MQSMERYQLLAGLLVVGFVIGWVSHAAKRSKAAKAPVEQEWEFVDALPPRAVASCVPPSKHDLAVYEAAATIIELEAEGDVSWLGIGARRSLASVHYRKEGADAVAVCAPASVYERVSAAIIRRKAFVEGRLTEYQLELAWRLPRSNPYVVEAVAQSAFDPQAQPSDTFESRDIRPFARTVLASFGEDAKKYSTIAYEQISGDSPMGTGAAQVAAATGHPLALQRIEALMKDMLSSIPRNKVIPYQLRNRLYELSWAIHFSGEPGRKYTAPIHALMKREVESHAPPFGMIELQPKQLCRLISLIEGEDAVRPYDYCIDDKVPYDK